MMSKLSRAFLILLSWAVLTPGVWADDAPVAAKDKKDKPLIVMLDWFVNPDHAALIVAQEKGFFAAQNVAVELQTPADPNDPPKLVGAGQADLAVASLNQRCPGKPFQILDLQRQRRLADRAGIGCPPEMAMLCKSREIAQVLQCYHLKNLSL